PPSEPPLGQGLMTPFATTHCTREEQFQHRGASGQTRVGRSFPRRNHRDVAACMAGPAVLQSALGVAVDDVCDQRQRLLRARIPGHALAGASAAVDLPPATAGHGALRRLHDVLDDADRDLADDRSQSLRTRGRLYAGEHRRGLPRDLDRHGAGPAGAVARVSAQVWAGVALLGGVGATARFLLDSSIGARFGAELPLGTFVVNVTGSLLLGLLTGLAVGGNLLVLADAATLGSYTTFSTWMLETDRLPRGGEGAGGS